MKTLKYNDIDIVQENEVTWIIPAHKQMRVPGKVFASEKMLMQILKEDESLKQVINVATLPGIQKYSLAMPDIHWGYGFPIGGVAATDIEEGVISPGGVGYDINCGVRLIRTNLEYRDVKPYMEKLVESLFAHVPTGVGAHGAIPKLSKKELNQVLSKGARWCIERGYGSPEDLECTEENGCLTMADPAYVSNRARERGHNQLGTLGSGNHFLELQMVEEIYDAQAAEVLGLYPGQLVMMIHCGSRGLGHQICDDYLKVFSRVKEKYGIHLPDPQLACAPIQSEEGKHYLAAMAAAANFAWANRQVIMIQAKKSFLSTLGISEKELGFSLIYDVCHNIAKIEEHQVNGKTKKVCVHRKGATRAFPPGHPLTPAKYQSVGQPVLIPGDMGRYSFVAVGQPLAMEESFGSSCHGAGRVKSRHKAKKEARGRDLLKEMEQMGVVIRARGMRTVAEEMPAAYKDVSQVVDVMHKAKISKKVAKLVPVGVIKG
ncbi:MAG: RtcB family protein [Calditrichaeota bacterium]|nr:MAG: RtcB family protein [Calditrichota bacterium]